MKVDWDFQPENYGYASKYYGAIPQTVGSIYTGYGGFGAPSSYGAPYAFGYGAPNAFSYGAPNAFGYGAPNAYGYGAHKPKTGNKEPETENLKNSEPDEFDHFWGEPEN